MKEQKQTKWFINTNIRAPKVMCIDQNNTNLGIMNNYQALDLAQQAGLDLVQMPEKDDKSSSSRVPIVKILDFGKYKYELSIKKKETEKKQRDLAIKVKEININPNIGLNDLQNKANQTQKFLDEGCKVRVGISAKRSHQKESVTKELILQTYEEFCQMLQPGYMIESSETTDERSALFVFRKVTEQELKLKKQPGAK